MFHFAANPPHPAICAVVVTFLNSGPAPVGNVMFQTAVPKSLELKLMPASSSVLPPANPMAGPTPVTQIMLISNPTKVPIKIRFKLSYVVNGQQVDDMGETDKFPPM